MSVRVRFAPSPTGLLHVGALRTVLYDYLFAKKLGGQCILRIEDTDRSRYNADSEQEFVDTLRWVGIEFNEGPHIGGPNAPYRQSERQGEGIYAKLIDELQAKGHAYKAFDTTEEIEQMREYQQINKVQIGYFGGDWRDAEPEKVEASIAEGKPFVVRLKIPRDRKIVVQDAIRGRVEFDSNTLPDPVLIKADGMPTYHFAAMVDDHLMGITHILRGEEWISTSPIHWLIFEFFGWAPPIFVHCPVIVGADGKKLSKRHGATRVLDYMAQGYLKSALKNFIALIGWSPGNDQEVFEEAELIQAFGLEGLQPSPGKFDMEKLKWLNGHRIRSFTSAQVLDEMEGVYAESHTKNYWDNFVDEEVLPNQQPRDGKAIYAKFENFLKFARENREYALACIEAEQERVTNLIEFGESCEFFIVEEPTMDAKAVEKAFAQPHVRALLEHLRDTCGVMPMTPDEYKEKVTEFQTANGIEKIGPIVQPTRVAMTGKTSGPGLFELMAVLGPERIAKRANRALTMLP
jgi:glutamyl-tRNA synthetase